MQKEMIYSIAFRLIEVLIEVLTVVEKERSPRPLLPMFLIGWMIACLPIGMALHEYNKILGIIIGLSIVPTAIALVAYTIWFFIQEYKKK